MKTSPVVRFNRRHSTDFVNELHNRVNKHFTDNNISKFGNTNMQLKSAFMLAMYFIPFVLLISGVVQSFGVMFILWCWMGLGMCGIGLAVMHDANHGAYSKRKVVNNLMGYLLNVIGSYHVTWKIQHNVLHHSSTNVHEFDEDLNNQILRFSPNQKRKKINKYQAYYAPFLYGLLSLYKTFSKDFEQISRFNKKKLLKGQGLTLGKAVLQISINKVLYLGVTLALPMIVLNIVWWQVLIGFIAMHLICGLILALIFQSAHVLDNTDFFMADEEGTVDNCWAIHQLNTTANFAKKGKLFSWLIGGLNFQVEHHLFPNICHVHYDAISDIVKKTALDFNLVYNEHRTFFCAIKSHFRFLNKLGQVA
ncbi:acyl-CoA desaturase [Reichenbachiella carrageenanivorans]|uniref:Acyl-CoA desaturase n=1 Tax=Reichenbachiella carrageenanivorans TaxID=2979869 RepID=A0ABY6D2M4_9BACT|nr:acyl-CoA desaturase [Reichenbachiella carrageenanivorans]UXX79338.1 acyl-CoA desaturase [Reichenbachiella carrageenanivorans]